MRAPTVAPLALMHQQCQQLVLLSALDERCSCHHLCPHAAQERTNTTGHSMLLLDSTLLAGTTVSESPNCSITILLVCESCQWP